MAEVFLAKQTRHGGLREARRRQAHPAAAVQRRRVRQDVPQRGARRGAAQPSERRADLRPRQARRAVLHRHGVRARRGPARRHPRGRPTPTSGRRSGSPAASSPTRSAGLHYAHTRVGADGKPLGLVHRDVSPQNVLVTYEGGVKLVDFGIAKATRAVDAAQTQAGLLKGKYAYMSPEQARGQPVDARSDVFCAGVLLWELATWQRLFKRPTDMATLMAVAEEPIRAPRTRRAGAAAGARSADHEGAGAQPRRCASPRRRRCARRSRSLIRTSGWEADTLALSTYMRELFAGKLRHAGGGRGGGGLGVARGLPADRRGEDVDQLDGGVADRRREEDAVVGAAAVAAGVGLAAGVVCRRRHGEDHRRGHSGAPRGRCHRALEPGSDDAQGRRSGAGATADARQAAATGVIVPSLAPLKATPTAATAGVVCRRRRRRAIRRR